MITEAPGDLRPTAEVSITAMQAGNFGNESHYNEDARHWLNKYFNKVNPANSPTCILATELLILSHRLVMGRFSFLS